MNDFSDSCRRCNESGKCHGDCCGPVGIPLVVFNKNKGIIKKLIEEKIEIGDTIYCLTDDGKCCFLSEDYKCIIYEDRPEICKMYGRIPDLMCPYVDLKGNLRSPAKVKRYQRIINHQVNNSMSTIENDIRAKERNRQVIYQKRIDAIKR